MSRCFFAAKAGAPTPDEHAAVNGISYHAASNLMKIMMEGVRGDQRHDLTRVPS